MEDLEARRRLIAERLRLAREMAGLSQGQAAKLLQMHRPSITEAEAGRRRVSAEELAAFSRIYRVSVGWLVGEQTEDDLSGPARIAARRLEHMKPDDLKQLMDVLRMLADKDK